MSLPAVGAGNTPGTEAATDGAASPLCGGPSEAVVASAPRRAASMRGAPAGPPRVHQRGHGPIHPANTNFAGRLGDSDEHASRGECARDLSRHPPHGFGTNPDARAVHACRCPGFRIPMDPKARSRAGETVAARPQAGVSNLTRETLAVKRKQNSHSRCIGFEFGRIELAGPRSNHTSNRVTVTRSSGSSSGPGKDSNLRPADCEIRESVLVQHQLSWLSSSTSSRARSAGSSGGVSPSSGSSLPLRRRSRRQPAAPSAIPRIAARMASAGTR